MSIDLPVRNGVKASTLQLPAGPWGTVLECLIANFPRIDCAVWLERMQRGSVLDEHGRALAPDHAHRAEMRVHYWREVSEEPRIPFLETILHSDAHLLVADKPHFLPVTPSGGFVEETLLARLIRRTGNAQLVPLHRIDRGTAGLVLFSADPASRARYQALFRGGAMHKRYIALAPALPGLDFPHTVRLRMVAGEPFFRMQVGAGTPNSETRIAVIEKTPDYWRYRLDPITGKKHQLRLHMAALGAPIRNDDFYPDVVADGSRAGDYSRPLQLLAQGLRFTDPLSGEPREFESQRQLQD